VISTKQDRKIDKKLGYSAVITILAISFLVIGTPETIAQGTNATNATVATSGAQEGQTTVVMPAGSYYWDWI
jgi:hypothetical protein